MCWWNGRRLCRIQMGNKCLQIFGYDIVMVYQIRNKCEVWS